MAMALSGGLFAGVHQGILGKSCLARPHAPRATPRSDAADSPGSTSAFTMVLRMTSLLTMSWACLRRKVSKAGAQNRRSAVLGCLSTSIAVQPLLPAAAAEWCEGSVFNGSWTIPESLGGKATISVSDGTAVITGSKGGQKWELRSTNIQGAPLVFRIAGVQRQFWVDWRPLGGPTELRGVWQGGMLDGPLATGPPEIKWDDGSRWRKVSCNAD